MKGGMRITQLAMCPTHGKVGAVVWKGKLVCPDPECHRTCSPAEGGTPFPLTCLCSHFAWNPKCPIHKPVKS